MEIEVFEVEPGRWAYRVGGVYQEWHPDKDGFIPMTQMEAEFLSTVVAARLVD